MKSRELFYTEQEHFLLYGGKGFTENSSSLLSVGNFVRTRFAMIPLVEWDWTKTSTDRFEFLYGATCSLRTCKKKHVVQMRHVMHPTLSPTVIK